ncbi:glycosyltransferase family 2 protein [Enterovibrio calviensis]|uniref:glycosyltransferase family 2 protein n=1 Tax=Enterovibrio calviensis TaxID=91359 RepID=UPI000686B5BD|nr:glycosyltransferase family 2 protein [Enterovibrio calviensis]
MRVSVVIPYFNDSEFVKTCIDSVLNQTLKPLEIILIDDFSSDSDILINILKGFDDNKIKLYRNKENKNGAFSRNLGIERSVGDYIALLDADDFWENDHLEKSLSFAVETDSDFVYSNVTEIRGCAYHRREVTDYKNVVGHPCNILLYSPPQTNSFLFSKKVRELLKFDETLRRHQDYQYLSEALLIEDIKVNYLDVYTTFYRERTSNKPVINYKSIFGFWVRYVNHIDRGRLKYKLWNIVAGGLRDRRVNAIELIEDANLQLIFGEMNVYKLIRKTKSDFIVRVFVNLYFYIFLDKCGKILKAVVRNEEKN